MLSKEEYHIAYHNGQKQILCERLDMLGGMEEELLQGTLFAYRCPSEKESALKWKKMFQEFSKRSFVIVSSIQHNGLQSVFKGKLRCVHRDNFRSYRKAPASKRDFGCKAGLNLYIRNLESKRSKNPTAGGYNLRVTSLPHAHNHSLDVALKFRRCGDSTKSILMELFDQYHTPASATELLKLRLLEQHGDNYLSEVADRAVLPDKVHVTRMYYETYRERYGNLSRKEVRKLQENAALKRLRLGPEQSEQTRAPSAERPSHSVKKEVQDDGRDDFMDAFDESGDLPSGWISGQVCYDEPPVSGEAGPEQNSALCGGSDVVAAAMASAEDRPAGSPEHVIVCYVDDDPTDSASAMLVDSTSYSESLNPASRPMDAAAADAFLVDAAGVEADVFVTTEEAVIGGVSVTVPSAGLLPTVSGIGSSPSVLGSPLLPPPPPVQTESAAAAAAAPSAEAVSREVSQWASELCRQLAADAGGQWRDAAATFVQNWELLPTPGRLTALCQFGRVTGLGRPDDSAKPQTARPTETAATQTGRPRRSEKPEVKSEPETNSEPETALPYSRTLCVLRSGGESRSAAPLDWVWTGCGLTGRPARAGSWGERLSTSGLRTARPSMITRALSARSKPEQHLRRHPSELRSGRR